jgi:hypothetical protein
MRKSEYTGCATTTGLSFDDHTPTTEGIQRRRVKNRKKKKKKKKKKKERKSSFPPFADVEGPSR